MLGKKTENPRPVSLAEVKAMLSTRAAEPDFGYEQQLSLDYSKKFCKLTPEDAKALGAGLSKIEALQPESVAKIIDILPEHAPTLQAILAREKITLSEKDLEKTLALVSEARTRMIAIEEPKPEGEGAAEGSATAPAAEPPSAPAEAVAEEKEKPAKEGKDEKGKGAKEEKKAKADDGKEGKEEKPKRKKKEGKD